MLQRRLLIDLENVPKSDYSLVTDDFLITIFVGKTQATSALIAVAEAAKVWGNRLSLYEVKQAGDEALDKVLVFTLGCLATEFPTDTYYILSKDKGYSPIVTLMKQRKVKCFRIEALSDLVPKPNTVVSQLDCVDQIAFPCHAEALKDPSYKRVYDNLKKIKGRPNTQEALSAHITSLCKQSVTKEEKKYILDCLMHYKIVCTNNGKLKYSFPSEEKS